MTLTADHSFPRTATIGVPYKLNGNRMLMRGLLRGGAITAAFIAIMVWFAPGATWESDVMLFKLGLSIASVFVSAAFWQASLPQMSPVVEIDTDNTELRLVRNDDLSHGRIIERCSFDALERVELNGYQIAFWAPNGRLLAEITLSNAIAHSKLMVALRHAGKLA